VNGWRPTIPQEAQLAAHLRTSSLKSRAALDQRERHVGTQATTLWCVLIVTDGLPRVKRSRSHRDTVFPGPELIAPDILGRGSKTSMNV
jgi:hypothetical protein